MNKIKMAVLLIVVFVVLAAVLQQVFYHIVFFSAGSVHEGVESFRFWLSLVLGAAFAAVALPSWSR